MIKGQGNFKIGAREQGALRWAVALVLAFAGCRPASTGETHSPSRVARLPYGDQYALSQKLSRDYSAVVTLQEYGRLDGVSAPLFLLRIGRGKTSSGARAPAVLITEATHGDEYLGVLPALQKSLAQMANSSSHPFFGKGGVVYLVPVVNPSGYTLGTRANGQGVDPNREFPSGPAFEKKPAAPEVTKLLAALEKRLADDKADLRLSLDYHCCSRAASVPMVIHSNFALPYRSGVAAVGAASAAALEPLFSRYFPGSKFGTEEKLLWSKSTGTSMDYFFDKFIARNARGGLALAISFEGLAQKEGEANLNSVQAHGALWKSLLEQAAK